MSAIASIVFSTAATITKDVRDFLCSRLLASASGVAGLLLATSFVVFWRQSAEALTITAILGFSATAALGMVLGAIFIYPLSFHVLNLSRRCRGLSLVEGCQVRILRGRQGIPGTVYLSLLALSSPPNSLLQWTLALFSGGHRANHLPAFSETVSR